MGHGNLNHYFFLQDAISGGGGRVMIYPFISSCALLNKAHIYSQHNGIQYVQCFKTRNLNSHLYFHALATHYLQQICNITLY